MPNNEPIDALTLQEKIHDWRERNDLHDSLPVSVSVPGFQDSLVIEIADLGDKLRMICQPLQVGNVDEGLRRVIEQLDEEKETRKKYQDIVYKVCNLLDQKRGDNRKVVISEVVEQLKQLLFPYPHEREAAKRHKANEAGNLTICADQPTVRLARIRQDYKNENLKGKTFAILDEDAEHFYGSTIVNKTLVRIAREDIEKIWVATDADTA